MSGWGIADTASEIEKIKAESADYLRGLNSCCLIDWNTYDKAFDFYMGLIDASYEQGKKDAEQRWIPVTERLPEEAEKTYWVCTDAGHQCECRWTNDMYGLGANEWSKWGWHVMDKPQYSKIIAWMPLPEPYRGEGGK